MTIRVKITNESNLYDVYSRNIEVTDGAGAKYTVAPEESVSVHVWEGTEISIIEVPLPTRRGGNDGYGALPPQVNS